MPSTLKRQNQSRAMRSTNTVEIPVGEATAVNRFTEWFQDHDKKLQELDGLARAANVNETLGGHYNHRSRCGT